MKHFTLGALLIGWMCGIGFAAAPPDTLTLPDLVGHPERWPATVTAARDFKFTTGAAIKKGDKLQVYEFDGQKVLLIAQKNLRFAADPADCGFVEAANAVWTALTPAQRAIDPTSLAADESLWPVKVATTRAIKGNSGAMPAGTELDVLELTQRDCTIICPHSIDALQLDYDMTDVIDRARKLVLIDPDKRPSRIATALGKVMVDADGKPVKDDHFADKKFYAIYFGAGWCPPCRAFSPDLVKFAKDTLPAHPELAMVMLNDDHSRPEMLKYMTDEQMPFPAIAKDDWSKSRLLVSYAAQIIPQFVVVDRFGKILVSNDDLKGNRGDPADALKALKKILDDQATTKP